MNTKQWKDKTLNSLLMERFGYRKKMGRSCEDVHPGIPHEQYLQENELEESTCSSNRDEELEEGDFPDLTGDGEVTMADVLKGRGVDLEDDK